MRVRQPRHLDRPSSARPTQKAQVSGTRAAAAAAGDTRRRFGPASGAGPPESMSWCHKLLRPDRPKGLAEDGALCKPEGDSPQPRRDQSGAAASSLSSRSRFSPSGPVHFSHLTAEAQDRVKTARLVFQQHCSAWSLVSTFRRLRSLRYSYRYSVNEELNGMKRGVGALHNPKNKLVALPARYFMET